jgi:hypothetical protein
MDLAVIVVAALVVAVLVVAVLVSGAATKPEHRTKPRRA